MRKYKVIALSVGGRANKIHESGDVVHENHFAPGRAEELVAKGFLKPIGEADESEDPKLGSGNDDGTGVDLTPMGKITVEQLKADLLQRGIVFEPNAKKQALYDLWTESHPDFN